MPNFSREALLSGEYFKDWDTYVTEQIYGRDFWIESYTSFNMNILGKRRINDIVIAEDGYLLPFIPYDKTHDFNALSEDINTMTDNMVKIQESLNDHGGQFIFVGVPTQWSYLRDKLPYYYNNDGQYLDYNEKAMFHALDKKNLNYINVARIFDLDDSSSHYHKTDHHYVFRSGYKVYREIINDLINKLHVENIRGPLREDEMEFITLPNPILGSRNRQLAYIYPTDEKFEIGYPVDKIDYVKKTNGNLDPEFYKISQDPKQRPDYSIYMGGDFAEINIQTDREELPNALIFGDSFTNALEPLLYYHFNETRILDLRHFKSKSLYDYISEFKPDIVIMIRDDSHYSDLTGNGKFN